MFPRRFSTRAAFALAAVLCTDSAPALDWKQESGYRWAAVVPTDAGKDGFTLLPPPVTGIAFENRLSQDRYTTNQIFLNGSGVALGDVDGDGRVDIYFCSLDGRNALYRNLGNWKFQDMTIEAGVACAGRACTGAALVDIDGDGDLDLLVNSVGGGTLCFLNDGKGHFTEVTQEIGLGEKSGAMSMALADVDGAGFLDLYVANYRSGTLRDQPMTQFRINVVNGKPVVALVNGRPVSEPDLEGRFSVNSRGQIIEHGEPDFFYRNDAGKHFRRRSFTDGTFVDETGNPISALHDWGLSVMFRDLNGDGLPDIYVCNDFDSPDRIWMNMGGGRFRALSTRALRESCRFSMGMDVADVNRDGLDDLLVLDMLSRDHVTRMTRADRRVQAGIGNERPQVPHNLLELNRGDGTYADLAFFSGLAASGWSWCPVFLDVDLDGYEDLLITTGHARDDMHLDYALRIERTKRRQKLSASEQLNLRRNTPPITTANVAFRNLGNLHFEEVGEKWGFNSTQVSHGIALGDLDNDGDLDVVINCLNGPALVYRNEAGGGRVGVRLKGRGGNTRGIGSRITLKGGAVAEQSQEMIAGGRYLSADDAMRVFAAGKGNREMSLEVKWRSGKRSVIEGVKANRIYEIEEPEGGPIAAREVSREETIASRAAAGKKLFEETSSKVGYVEQEDGGWDEFERQPTLTRRLGGLGYGLSWYDVDGDGREDLVIAGKELGVFWNDGQGGFKRMEGFGGAIGEEKSSVLGWQDEKGEKRLITGVWNYREGKEAKVVSYGKSGKRVEVGGNDWSVGPVAMADMDGEGELELFVGGRVKAGRYPEDVPSEIYRRHEGKWEKDLKNSKVVETAGMVSGAVWTDLDGDGYPELVLACEWGPVRVYENKRGQLREATREWGLDGYEGLWNGIGAGDFDGDGRMDLVVSNWGRNSLYELGQGLRVYYGDVDGDGVVELMESSWDEEMKKEVPWSGLERLSRGMGFLKERFGSFQAYGQASVEEVLGAEKGMMKMKKAGWLGTSVLLNRGRKFEVREIGGEGQWSAGYGVSVGDLDGDGKEDVFLSENFFGVDEESSRLDSGRGLWLKGDGKGGFKSMSSEESGIKIYGEGRGSGLSDYDGDGRVDLAVVERGYGVRLYHNVGGKAGLRVRLEGDKGNPEGVGAQMRLRGAGWEGAAREVHKGSGYWSEDGAVQVMGYEKEPEEVWVRWPGGKEMVVKVPAGAKEVRVRKF